MESLIENLLSHLDVIYKSSSQSSYSPHISKNEVIKCIYKMLRPTLSTGVFVHDGVAHNIPLSEKDPPDFLYSINEGQSILLRSLHNSNNEVIIGQWILAINPNISSTFYLNTPGNDQGHGVITCKENKSFKDDPDSIIFVGISVTLHYIYVTPAVLYSKISFQDTLDYSLRCKIGGNDVFENTFKIRKKIIPGILHRKQTYEKDSFEKIKTSRKVRTVTVDYGNMVKIIDILKISLLNDWSSEFHDFLQEELEKMTPNVPFIMRREQERGLQYIVMTDPKVAHNIIFEDSSELGWYTNNDVKADDLLYIFIAVTVENYSVTVNDAILFSLKSNTTFSSTHTFWGSQEMFEFKFPNDLSYSDHPKTEILPLGGVPTNLFPQ